MGTLSQIENKHSHNSNLVQQKVLLSVSANPVSGSRLFISPTEYYFASAAAGLDAARPATVLVGATVSATVSALSAMINIVAAAHPYGPTAVTAADTTTDLELTAPNAGHDFDYAVYFTSGAAVDIDFSQTTANVAGPVMGETIHTLITSAGNKLYFGSPGEANTYKAGNRAQFGNASLGTN